MEIITSVPILKARLQEFKRIAYKKTGFVPTMGALHKGHISLIERCKNECDYTIASIFVNPTQFNNPDDFKNYPKTIEQDIAMLEDINCDIVFIPNEAEMYPENDSRIFDFGRLDKILEGFYRPGHFNGVAQIVSKFLEIINPDFAYFGEKDFQQLAVIQNLAEQMNSKTIIVPCKTMRETDGLAMSSRNLLLSPEHRQIAPLIYKTLSAAKEFSKEHSVGETRKMVIDAIDESGLLKVEYFEIINAETFEYINNWKERNRKVGCIAVYAGKIRLIDNIRFN